MLSQQKIQQQQHLNDTPDSIPLLSKQNIDCSNVIDTSPCNLLRSTRQISNYQSSQEEANCIICYEEKSDAHGKKIPVLTMTFREDEDPEHKVEKQLKFMTTKFQNQM